MAATTPRRRRRRRRRVPTPPTGRRKPGGAGAEKKDGREIARCRQDDDAPAPVVLKAPPMPPRRPPSPQTPRRPCPAWDSRAGTRWPTHPHPTAGAATRPCALVEAPAADVPEKKATSSPSSAAAPPTRRGPQPIAARVWPRTQHGQQLRRFCTRVYQAAGLDLRTTANRTGGLYAAPGAKGSTRRLRAAQASRGRGLKLLGRTRRWQRAVVWRRFFGGGGFQTVDYVPSVHLPPQTGTKGLVTFFATKSKKNARQAQDFANGHGEGRNEVGGSARGTRACRRGRAPKGERQAASELVLPR